MKQVSSPAVDAAGRMRKEGEERAARMPRCAAPEFLE
jgi:hypothetical protein